MQWTLWILSSAVMLALYDLAKKASVRNNAVLPVLLCSTVFGCAAFSLGLLAAGRLDVLDGASLHDMWYRRMSTKYNGTSYIIQRAAEKVFTDEGQAAVHEDIAYYMENAHILRTALTKAGIWTTGGDNAPYIWLKAPHGLGSWDCFDMLLNDYAIAGTPGVGFGTAGEGYLRFSSFGTRETVTAAAKLLETL